MLARAVSALRGAGAVRVSAVASADVPGDLETVRDVFEGKGALGGIHAALASAESDKVFVLGCDFPFITPEFIELLAGTEPGEDEGCIVPEQPDGMLQPLAAVYSKAKCFEKCAAILSDENASHAVAALLDSAGCKIIPFGEYSGLPNARRLLMNVNTPEELERARDLAASGKV